jgi:hypothetical protein
MPRHIYAGIITATLIAASVFAGVPVAPERLSGNEESVLSTHLRSHLVRYRDAEVKAGKPSRDAFQPVGDNNPLFIVNDRGAILTNIRVDTWTDALVDELRVLGADVIRTGPRWGLIDAWLTPGAVKHCAEHPAVKHIRAISRPIRRVGSVLSEGVSIHGADSMQALGYNGEGVTVGVLSDGVDNITTAQSSGDLPQNVPVVPGFEGDGDEGIAMLEIVHDIAPSAELAFASAWGGQLGFVEAIRELAVAGCDVLVDDIGYFAEPDFEDGPIAQVIDSVYGEGIAYYSSAGNSANGFYHGDFDAAGTTSWHAWDGADDSTFAITVPSDDEVTVVLKWSDRFAASGNDYDLFLSGSPDLFGQSELLDVGGDFQDGAGDPVEFVYYFNDQPSTQTIYVGVDLFAGDPKHLRLAVFGGSSLEYVTKDESILGHSSANGAMAVGAIHASDPGHDDIASYSSRGPSVILYPEPETRLKPDITGIDGVSVTGAGNFPSTFFGTSASAPHIAALAALLLHAHPTWSAADVNTALRRGAADRGEVGPDNIFGYGLADVVASLSGPASMTISGTVSTTIWRAANGPYRITGATTVPSGDTLTIESGVEVIFEVDVPFIVDGILRVEGSRSDSVRFYPDVDSTSEWGGIHLYGDGLHTISYARISGGHTHGAGTLSRGGGIRVEGSATTLRLEHSSVIGNVAEGSGGGVAVIDAALDASHTIIADNSASDGGGLYVSGSGGTVLRHVTLAGNSASSGAAIFADNTSVNICDCIVWSATAPISASSSTIDARYSIVGSGFEGNAILTSNPQFVDSAMGDYRLSVSSPAINAGDPTSPLDPDGTRSDLGALPYTFDTLPMLSFSEGAEGVPGGKLSVSIYATAEDIVTADLAIEFDPNYLGVGQSFIVNDPFVGDAQTHWTYQVQEDTVRLHLAVDSSAALSLNAEELVTLEFDIMASAAQEELTELYWLEFPQTNIDGQVAQLLDGFAGTLPVVYGDASGDGSVSMYDVSIILQYIVGLLDHANAVVSDVSDDGSVTSYDAALVMRRALDPEYLFPIEGGTVMSYRTVAGRTLEWIQSGNGWSLTTNEPSSVLSGEVRLLVTNSHRELSVPTGSIAQRESGDTLHVAFARSTGFEQPVLLHVASNGGVDAPQVLSARLNEDPMATTVYATDAANLIPFALSANVPNPFNPSTRISFSIPQSGTVRLVVYSTTGQTIRTLVDGQLSAGRHMVVWDGLDGAGRQASSGVYIYRLTSGNRSTVRTMVLLR